MKDYDDKKKKKKADKTQDPFGVQIVQWICIL